MDWENARIRKVDTSGIVSTFAGTGEFGYSGDDGPATEAKIAPIYGGVTVDREGNVYFADNENHRIRKVTPDGVISTIAGKEDSEVGDGDGGPATEARFEMVADVRLDGEGNIYLKDERAGTIQKIDKEGTIRTIAGGGVCRPLERECQATEARLSFNWGWIFDGPKLSSMAVTPEGHVYFTDGGGLIWMLKPL